MSSRQRPVYHKKIVDSEPRMSENTNLNNQAEKIISNENNSTIEKPQAKMLIAPKRRRQI